MIEQAEHETRVKQFQNDLRKLSRREVVRKHITTGLPAIMVQEDYYELRRLVAEQFQLHPSEVILVGSSRLGFSLNPLRRYDVVKENSDLDLALISAVRFDAFWDSVFGYASNNLAWRNSAECRFCIKMLFDGWLDPRGLPPANRFKAARNWTEFFDNLMQSRQFGTRQITARLYRSWDRLESYQEIAVRKCASVNRRKTP